MCLPMQSPRVTVKMEVDSSQHEEREDPQKMGWGRASVGEVLPVCYLSDLRLRVALIKVTFIGCEMFSFVR